MDAQQLTAIFADGIYLVVAMVGVLIMPGMVVGLVIAVLQAATQVNEQTLSFLPRLLITLLMVLFAGNWLLQQLADLFNRLFLDIPMLIG
ncbi:export protein FliQ family 3 [Ferrimonas balearica DSM 9799]|uniref:Export protein FliQ family 3 n=1 Tax=Ferrimonas balearica (strain DSM 9799 / CCM 4581 / KCTC 23876 / PAT) TaxID=550540 RepID=E1SM17_FERBD|nr:flagellar biosynthetic protein FliQ [Ferrimonas balearica]MBY6017010.1 flagellar biosynthetic protein FliQ [Halomonas denitrificans]ADN76535.1 export protein FliQ family 3 [Ferrimonas balearica DSM 9799]MBW3139435.1 flagellar biosynthetic protein FliQ [Ferrimonas balearica]MBW3162977.1 flagellar biosynthetic protein FliQ [Ferrimonas balearica]MBY5980669.1 flagellar biosynthetic protein FliQ [Ferrimonas balearica]